MSWKMIILDEPVRNFLGRLRELRLGLGMSQRELAGSINIPKGTLQMYELGLNNPSFTVLARLAEVFGYDLSSSVNYKYYFKQINMRDIKLKLRRYGLTYSELSKSIGYNKQTIYETLSYRKNGSVFCFVSVCEFLNSEIRAENFRRSYVGIK